MRNLIKTVLLAAVMALAVLPASANAATTCSFNPADSADGDVMYMSGSVLATRLTVAGGMTCTSARYVTRRFLRPQYRRNGHVNRTFWDGYVLWHGSESNQSPNATTITYREHRTFTSFSVRLRRV